MNSFHKTDLARELRRQQTMAERKMWWQLRSRAMAGYKFYRQFPIGPFVVDFCCRSRKLVIELDGGQHNENKEYDQERTQFLGGKGYRVLRFWNNDFLNHQMETITAIMQDLEQSPHPALSHFGEGARRAGEGSA